MGIKWGSSWLEIIFYDRLRDPSATGDTITQHTYRGFATSSQILPLFWIKVFLMASITSRTNQLTAVEQPSKYSQYSMQGKYFIPMPQYLGTWPMPCLVHLSNSLAAMTRTEATRMRGSNGLVDPYWSIKIPMSSHQFSLFFITSPDDSDQIPLYVPLSRFLVKMMLKYKCSVQITNCITRNTLNNIGVLLTPDFHWWNLHVSHSILYHIP